MTDANVFVGTFGGYFSKMIIWPGQPVVIAQNGGRITYGSWTGSGANVTVNSYFTNDGSAGFTTGNAAYNFWSQGRKIDPWSGEYKIDYAIASMEPYVGADSFFVQGPDENLTTPPTPASYNYYGNTFAGVAGPSQNAVRSGASWLNVSNDPAQGVFDTGSVKTYPGNQWTFGYHTGPVFTWNPTPLEDFNEFWVYHSSVDPDYSGIMHEGSNLNLCYEACYDPVGFAHWDNVANINGQSVLQTSLEVMFWTYDHNLLPDTSPPEGGYFALETDIDLNHDGNLWDLYVYSQIGIFGLGGLKYSFFIWYPHSPAVGKYGWVDHLSGMNYAVMHYVHITGTEPAYNAYNQTLVPVPSNALECLFSGTSFGFEVRSTNYLPVPFRMTDFRVRQS